MLKFPTTRSYSCGYLAERLACSEVVASEYFLTLKSMVRTSFRWTPGWTKYPAVQSTGHWSGKGRHQKACRWRQS
ncbi:MAG: hypothetical protein K0U40_03320, partial [Betaproteobacteria bacterium]|nr:hypothetical protein [Betaproteobacteria bacterium]